MSASIATRRARYLETLVDVHRVLADSETSVSERQEYQEADEELCSRLQELDEEELDAQEDDQADSDRTSTAVVAPCLLEVGERAPGLAAAAASVSARALAYLTRRRGTWYTAAEVRAAVATDVTVATAVGVCRDLLAAGYVEQSAPVFGCIAEYRVRAQR